MSQSERRPLPLPLATAQAQWIQQQRAAEYKVAELNRMLEQARTTEEAQHVLAAKESVVTVASEMKAESEQFYTSIGHPELAGKYQPFVVPEGYKVKELKEGTEGLEVTFEEKERQVPVSSSPLGLQMLWVKEETGEHFLRGSKGEWVKLVAGLSPSPHEMQALLGMSLVSAVALPSAIPKLAIPAVIGIGVAEAAKLRMMGQHLTVEEIIGAASVGEVIGLVGMNIAIPKVQRMLEPRASKWLTESYEESARLMELWKPSLAERLVMRVTGATPKEFPTGIMGLPKMTEAEALGMTNMSKFITGMEAYEWTEVPETVGFGLTTRAAVETAKEAVKAGLTEGIKQVAETLPYTVYQAGRQISLAKPMGLGFEKTPYAMGYEGKLGFVKERLPSLKDLVKEFKGETVLGSSPVAQVILGSREILPKLSILPELAAENLPKLAPAIFGVGAILMPLQKGLQLERQVQKPKRETKLVPLVGLKALTQQTSLSKTILTSAEAVKQTTRQKQRLEQIQIQRMLTPEELRTKMMQFPSVPHLPREEISLSSAIFGKKGAFWYKRHPVASGSEVAAHIFEGLPRLSKRHAPSKSILSAHIFSGLPKQKKRKR